MKLGDNDWTKVFVSTGAGLAPFVGMINQAGQLQPHIPIKLFAGLRDNIANFTQDFFRHPALDLLVTISGSSREESWPTFVSEGRINKLLTNNITSKIAKESEFYLCGNPDFVASTREFLENIGAASIVEESFGTVIK